MNAHTRISVPAEAVLPIDAVEAVTGINPRWDIAQLASRGHVLLWRAHVLTRDFGPGLFWMAVFPVVFAIRPYLANLGPGYGPIPVILYSFGHWVLAFIAFFSIAPGLTTSKGVRTLAVVCLTWIAMMFYLNGRGPNLSIMVAPTAIRNALTYDRHTYFDLGGGLRGGPEVAWMSDYRPKPESLSTADYVSLVKALRADLATHGLNAKDWATIAGMEKRPQITRAEKAITQYADRLATTGIVVVPENGPILPVIAHVEGQWSLTLVSPRNCAVLIGPFIPDSGCADQVAKPNPITGYAAQTLASIKPTAEKE